MLGCSRQHSAAARVEDHQQWKSSTRPRLARSHESTLVPFRFDDVFSHVSCSFRNEKSSSSKRKSPLNFALVAEIISPRPSALQNCKGTRGKGEGDRQRVRLRGGSRLGQLVDMTMTMTMTMNLTMTMMSTNKPRYIHACGMRMTICILLVV